MSAAQEEHVDIVVLGAGSGGYAAALRAAELGQRVVLVEASRVGGTCLHSGCIPTKALLHAGQVADQVRNAPALGVHAELAGVDIAAVNTYKDGIVGRLHKGLQGLIAARSIEVVTGYGRLVSADTVAVGDRLIRADHVVLATGSRSRSLPGLSIGGRVMTSDQALVMDWIPRSVVIVGGGVIGVEFASLWRSFGAEVTIVETLPRLLPAEDEAVSAALQRAFRKRDITVRADTRISDVADDGSGVHITLDNDSTLQAEAVLVAVGREPVSDGMGLREIGIELDQGFVSTDEQLYTGVGNVYAVGDLVAGLQLAHRGFAHGIFVAEKIAGQKPAPIDESQIPRVTYCDPEVASVGLTEAQARDAHGAEAIETVEYNLAGNGRSQILGTTGFVKMIRESAGPIIGVHMIGNGMSEQIAEGQLIVGWQAYPEDLAPLLHAHPTQNEALGEAALALAGKPLHSHN